jgi:hypothetical protein
MNLGELIKALEKIENKDAVVEHGFYNPHSWRGSYEELAFEPTKNVTIQSMLDCAKEALGKTYEGYKGGDFKMKEYTDIHISEYGSSDDFVWEFLINFWKQP